MTIDVDRFADRGFERRKSKAQTRKAKQERNGKYSGAGTRNKLNAVAHAASGAQRAMHTQRQHGKN